MYNVGKERAYKKSIKARTGGPEWVESFYVSDTYEVEKDSAHPGGELQRTSIYLGSLLVAVVEEDGNGTTEINYHHQDHLGGSSVVTNSQRQIVKSQDYYPFGSSRVSTGNYDADSHGFTDQERDEETNLHYYGARYYNTDIGRFTGQDPLQMRPSDLAQTWLNNPQALNFYAYTLNNPLKWVDENGEFSSYSDEEIVENERKANSREMNSDGEENREEDEYSKLRNRYLKQAAYGWRCLICGTDEQEALQGYLEDPSSIDIAGMTDAEVLAFHNMYVGEAVNSMMIGWGGRVNGNSIKNLINAQKNLRKRFSEHLQKLVDYTHNPLGYDNQARLMNSQVQHAEKVVAGRVRRLTKEIGKFAKQYVKALLDSLK